MCNNLTNKIDTPSDCIRGARDGKSGQPAEVGASDDYMDAYNENAEAVNLLADFGLDNRVSLFQ